ncbi:MAG TPA: DPP IV N-terminal domain-containing protein, partial [Pyrinomonadaceae bacterium]|nr:DPP IV N-terminal domain-containing protein [Pyrinomonadaceae bacterium]
MRRLRLRLSVLALALLCAPAVFAQSRAPFSIQELLKVRRVADPQLSPDGRWVAYQVTTPDPAANRNRTQVYVIPINGGEPKQLTSGASNAMTPRWSPDGRKLAYVTGGQIWTMDPDGSDKKQLTKLSTGADAPVWSPDGRLVAFTSDVYPDCADDDCNRRRDEAAEANPVKAHTADRLLYRHWTTWKDGKRTHVFVIPAGGGAARDLTPGDYDAPPFSLGGPSDYAFSPDSRELAFARNTDKMEATSTNSDIFVVPVTGGEPRRLTGSNRGADQSPLYSPDGRYLAYRSQATAGFESARWRLMLYDRRSQMTRELLPRFDAYVEGFTFTPDGNSIYFVSGERGRQPIYVAGVADGQVRKLVEGFNDDVQVSRDSRFLVFSRSTADRPVEIYTARLDGTVPLGPAQNQAAALTHTNDDLMASYGLRPAEELTWTGALGAKVQGWLFKPADFDPARKYPLLVLIHGGPQGAFNDAWGYRWNPQVFASRGY